MAFTLHLMGETLWVGQFSQFPHDLVTHGISTRFGGVSQTPYDDLNMALHVGDAPEAVVENRRRFCDALGLSAERMATAEQVHGDRIVCATEKKAGRGFRDYGAAIRETDALLTDVPGLPLLLCYADCVPVLFVDPVRRAVAVAHAGWKGTVRRIAEKTLAAMTDAFGTAPKDCLAAIGPSIGPAHYLVGEDVAAQFRAAFPLWAKDVLHVSAGSLHLDLWTANRLQLEAAGLSPEHIETANVSTAANAKLFFSYRADRGKTGRIAAVIALR